MVTLPEILKQIKENAKQCIAIDRANKRLRRLLQWKFSRSVGPVTAVSCSKRWTLYTRYAVRQKHKTTTEIGGNQQPSFPAVTDES